MSNDAKSKNKPVTQPFLGLFLDRPGWQVDPRGFTDCNNVRIDRGQVTNSKTGWAIQPSFQYNGAITMDANFHLSVGVDVRIVGTPTDLYNVNNGDPKFITPTYKLGTVSVSGVNVTGLGTFFSNQIGGTGMSIRANVKPGDYIYIGSDIQNSPSANWIKVIAVVSNTQLTLASAPGDVSGAKFTVRQLAQGDTNNFHWAWEIYPAAGDPFNGDVFFCTNGVDFLVSWKPEQTFAKYENNMPFTCFELRRYKNMMIYGGLVYKGELIPAGLANSDNGRPTIMNQGIAGQYIVSDGPYTINWLGILGNVLMVYLGDEAGGGAVISANFVGGSVNFIFNKVIEGRGPIGSRLVAEFPDRHQFLGADSEYRYNGLFTQVINTQVWRTVLQNFDTTRSNASYCFINYQYGELIWALPLLTDPDLRIATAYVEHYMEQANSTLFKPMTKRDFPFSIVSTHPQETYLKMSDLLNGWNTYIQRWNSFDTFVKEAYPPQWAGDLNGFNHILYYDTIDGGPIGAFANFPPRLTINERSRGLVKRVYPYLESDNANVTVSLSMYDKVGGVATIIDKKVINQSTSVNRFTTHYRRGRLFQLSFSSNEANKPWFLDGYDVDIVPGGLR